MSDRDKRVTLKNRTFKHGGYSAIAVLPGENRAEYERRHQGLIAQYSPNGPLEDHLVADLARLIWRKENLSTFRIAELARQPFIDNEDEEPDYDDISSDPEEIAAECAAAIKGDEESARKQLGELYELIAVGEIATIPYLQRELRLHQVLDDMIDRCMKRLLHAKGLHSISTASASASVQRPAPPPKAA